MDLFGDMMKVDGKLMWRAGYSNQFGKIAFWAISCILVYVKNMHLIFEDRFNAALGSAQMNVGLLSLGLKTTFETTPAMACTTDKRLLTVAQNYGIDVRDLVPRANLTNQERHWLLDSIHHETWKAHKYESPSTEDRHMIAAWHNEALAGDRVGEDDIVKMLANLRQGDYWDDTLIGFLSVRSSSLNPKSKFEDHLLYDCGKDGEYEKPSDDISLMLPEECDARLPFDPINVPHPDGEICLEDYLDPQVEEASFGRLPVHMLPSSAVNILMLPFTKRALN